MCAVQFEHYSTKNRCGRKNECRAKFQTCYSCLHFLTLLTEVRSHVTTAIISFKAIKTFKVAAAVFSLGTINPSFRVARRYITPQLFLVQVRRILSKGLNTSVVAYSQRVKLESCITHLLTTNYDHHCEVSWIALLRFSRRM